MLQFNFFWFNIAVETGACSYDQGVLSLLVVLIGRSFLVLLILQCAVQFPSIARPASLSPLNTLMPLILTFLRAFSHTS